MSMHILNFGSLNLDRSYLVPHFVGTGETLSSCSMTESVGGKGFNQSIALSRAGCAVCHAGKVGLDGAILRGELTAAGVDATRVITDLTTATGHAIIQVDALGQNCILLYGGANLTITKEDVDRALEGFGPGDWLFLQNETSCLAYLIRRGAELGMTIVLNPSPITETLINCDLSCVSWLILNEVEGAGMTGCHDAKNICKSLHCRYPDVNFVLTLGKNGAICTDPSGFVWQSIFPVETVDSTAAGDTFTGYFFSAIYQGMPHSEALRRGAMASALSVSRSGSAISIPNQEQVESALAQLQGNSQAQPWI